MQKQNIFDTNELECMHPRLQSRQCGHSTHPVLHFSQNTSKRINLRCVFPRSKTRMAYHLVSCSFLSWHRWWQSFAPFHLRSSAATRTTGWNGSILDWKDPFIFPFRRFSFSFGGRTWSKCLKVCVWLVHVENQGKAY